MVFIFHVSVHVELGFSVGYIWGYSGMVRSVQSMAWMVKKRHRMQPVRVSGA